MKYLEKLQEVVMSVFIIVLAPLSITFLILVSISVYETTGLKYKNWQSSVFVHKTGKDKVKFFWADKQEAPKYYEKNKAKIKTVWRCIKED